MIDLAELETAEPGLHFREDVAETLEELGRLFAIPWQKQPRKRRNIQHHDFNIQTWKQDAVRHAIQEIDVIRIVNGGKEPGVKDDKHHNPRYHGPLVDLITLLCRQLAVPAPGARTVHRAIKAKQSV
jgi:hypothetical protein